jgi:hypothetical protein
MIDLDGLSTWHSTLEPDTPKAGANPLYSCVNKVAFQFRKRRDDHHNRPAQRCAAIELFTE